MRSPHDGDGPVALRYAIHPAPFVPHRTCPSGSRPDLSGVRVLVCEDEGITLLQILMALQRGGAQVVGAAHSSAEAVAMAERLQPDVVLVDLSLPDATGVAAIERIGTATGACVVAMGDDGEPRAATRALVAGAATHIAKPFAGDGLPRCLLDALAFHLATRDSASRPSVTPPSAAALG